jgi:hypothetical protein
MLARLVATQEFQMKEPVMQYPNRDSSSHTRLLDAGWSYRTNADRGWIIYRDPATSLWHPRDEAIRILDIANAFAVAG